MDVIFKRFAGDDLQLLLNAVIEYQLDGTIEKTHVDRLRLQLMRVQLQELLKGVN